MSLFPEPPPKPKREPQGPHPDCIRAWDAAWLRTRACRYVWTPKDAVLVAKALKMADGDPSAVTTRINRLLDETEDRWVASNASPGQLVARWNLLAVDPPKSKNRVTPLPAYVPFKGPRVAPPPNLMQMFNDAKQRYAQRLIQPGATKAPSG